MHLVIKLIVTRATGSIPVDCSISYSVRVKLDCNVTNIRVLQTGFFLLGHSFRQHLLTGKREVSLCLQILSSAI